MKEAEEGDFRESAGKKRDALLVAFLLEFITGRPQREGKSSEENDLMCRFFEWRRNKDYWLLPVASCCCFTSQTLSNSR
jgi:hypothetical protein